MRVPCQFSPVLDPAPLHDVSTVLVPGPTVLRISSRCFRRPSVPSCTTKAVAFPASAVERVLPSARLLGSSAHVCTPYHCVTDKKLRRLHPVNKLCLSSRRVRHLRARLPTRAPWDGPIPSRMYVNPPPSQYPITGSSFAPSADVR